MKRKVDVSDKYLNKKIIEFLKSRNATSVNDVVARVKGDVEFSEVEFCRAIEELILNRKIKVKLESKDNILIVERIVLIQRKKA